MHTVRIYLENAPVRGDEAVGVEYESAECVKILIVVELYAHFFRNILK